MLSKSRGATGCSNRAAARGLLNGRRKSSLCSILPCPNDSSVLRTLRALEELPLLTQVDDLVEALQCSSCLSWYAIRRERHSLHVESFVILWNPLDHASPLAILTACTAFGRSRIPRWLPYSSSCLTHMHTSDCPPLPSGGTPWESPSLF